MLSRRGVRPLDVYEAPTSVLGITEILLRVAEQMIVLYIREDLASFDVVSTVYELLLDALAAEHGARLVATGVAADWIDDWTERLCRSAGRDPQGGRHPGDPGDRRRGPQARRSEARALQGRS